MAIVVWRNKVVIRHSRLVISIGQKQLELGMFLAVFIKLI